MIEYFTVVGGTLAVRVVAEASALAIDLAGASELFRVLCGRIMDADEGRDRAIALRAGTLAFWVGTVSRVFCAEGMR